MTNFFTNLFDLEKDEDDKQKTLENIKNSTSFTGANLWILACAIMVACIGLNVNSTAVIIGAMLISPLMAPILGAGFALGIYDFDLLRKSLIDLLIATVVSLTVATLYFFLSPFKEVQSELLARTSPNIYDVLIAFFGGLAGVIAMTRVQKGNPIPGVAIATALMPPLCTAGYGLATGNWKFFLGALFLYSINCVFICIATFAMVKYLKYPASQQIDIKHQKQVRYGVTTIVVLMLVPSVFFAFILYKEQHFKQLTNEFIEKEFIENGDIVVFKKIKYATTSPKIELAFFNKVFTDLEVEQLQEKLQRAGLPNAKLIIRQDTTDNLQDFKNDILNEVNKKDNFLSEKYQMIDHLQQKIYENKFDNKQLLSEMNIFFPTITAVSVFNQNITSIDTTKVSTFIIYRSTRKLVKADKYKLKNWMVKKIGIEKIELSELEK